MVAVAPVAVVSTPPTTPLAVAQAPARRAEDYLGLVRKVAYGMVRRLPSHVDVADLMSSGTIGLLDAIAKFDTNRNENFEAYAELRIRGAIFDELRSLDWVPRSVRSKSRGLAKAIRALEVELGRAPAEEEIAETLGLEVCGLHALRDVAHAWTMHSIDDMMGANGEARLGAAGEADDDILRDLCQQSTTKALAEAIDQLPERLRLVVSLYYFEGLKQKEIGAILGVTESRVCQVQKQALVALAKALSAVE